MSIILRIGAVQSPTEVPLTKEMAAGTDSESMEAQPTPEHCRSPLQTYPGCFGLPYQDHNYGAPRPPTPPQSPPSAPVVIPPPEIEIPLPRSVVVPSLDVNGTSEDSVTRCICQFQHDDGYMICCDKCSVWQHIDCMGIDRNNIPEMYFCELCETRQVDIARAVQIQTRKREEMTDTSATDTDPEEVANHQRALALATNTSTVKKKNNKKVKEKDNSSDNKIKKVKKVVKKENKKLKLTVESPVKRIIKVPLVMPKEPKTPVKAKINRKAASLFSDGDVGQDPWNCWLSPWVDEFESVQCNHYSKDIQDITNSKRYNGQRNDEMKSTYGDLQARFCCRLASVKEYRKGLQASRDIAADEVIIDYTGTVRLQQEREKDNIFFSKFQPFTLHYTKFENFNILIDSMSCGNDARFVRRSCTPNAEVRHLVEHGKIHFLIYSTKVIPENSEITIPFDYDFLQCTFAVECACSRTNCEVAKLHRNARNKTVKRRKSRVQSKGTSTEDVCASPEMIMPVSMPTQSPEKKSTALTTLNINTVCEPKKATPAMPPRSASTATRSSVQPLKTAATPVPGEISSPLLTQEVKTEHDGAHDHEDEAKKKMTREERKMDAILKAFEKLEKREERKKEAMSKHDNTKKVPEVKMKKEKEEHVEPPPPPPPEPVVQPVPKPARKKARKGSTPARRRSRMNSGNSSEAHVSQDESLSSVSAPCTPLPSSDMLGLLTPPLTGASGAAGPGFRFKTKKHMLNEWYNDRSQEARSSPSKTEMLEVAVDETMFVTCLPSPRNNMDHLRRNSHSSGCGRMSGDGSIGSAKKRWLRQVMVEKQMPDSEKASPAHSGSCASPNPTAALVSPGGSPPDFVTPLKKRRLARESLSQDHSLFPTPSTPSPSHTPSYGQSGSIDASTPFEELRNKNGYRFPAAQLTPIMPEGYSERFGCNDISHKLGCSGSEKAETSEHRESMESDISESLLPSTGNTSSDVREGNTSDDEDPVECLRKRIALGRRGEADSSISGGYNNRFESDCSDSCGGQKSEMEVDSTSLTDMSVGGVDSTSTLRYLGLGRSRPEPGSRQVNIGCDSSDTMEPTVNYANGTIAGSSTDVLPLYQKRNHRHHLDCLSEQPLNSDGLADQRTIMLREADDSSHSADTSIQGVFTVTGTLQNVDDVSEITASGQGIPHVSASVSNVEDENNAVVTASIENIYDISSVTGSVLAHQVRISNAEDSLESSTASTSFGQMQCASTLSDSSDNVTSVSGSTENSREILPLVSCSYYQDSDSCSAQDAVASKTNSCTVTGSVSSMLEVQLVSGLTSDVQDLSLVTGSGDGSSRFDNEVQDERTNDATTSQSREFDFSSASNVVSRDSFPTVTASDNESANEQIEADSVSEPRNLESASICKEIESSSVDSTTCLEQENVIGVSSSSSLASQAGFEQSKSYTDQPGPEDIVNSSSGVCSVSELSEDRSRIEGPDNSVSDSLLGVVGSLNITGSTETNSFFTVFGQPDVAADTNTGEGCVNSSSAMINENSGAVESSACSVPGSSKITCESAMASGLCDGPVNSCSNSSCGTLCSDASDVRTSGLHSLGAVGDVSTTFNLEEQGITTLTGQSVDETAGDSPAQSAPIKKKVSLNEYRKRLKDKVVDPGESSSPSAMTSSSSSKGSSRRHDSKRQPTLAPLPLFEANSLEGQSEADKKPEKPLSLTERLKQEFGLEDSEDEEPEPKLDSSSQSYERSGSLTPPPPPPPPGKPKDSNPDLSTMSAQEGYPPYDHHVPQGVPPAPPPPPQASAVRAPSPIPRIPSLLSLQTYSTHRPIESQQPTSSTPGTLRQTHPPAPRPSHPPSPAAPGSLHVGRSSPAVHQPSYVYPSGTASSQHLPTSSVSQPSRFKLPQNTPYPSSSPRFNQPSSLVRVQTPNAGMHLSNIHSSPHSSGVGLMVPPLSNACPQRSTVPLAAGTGPVPQRSSGPMPLPHRASMSPVPTTQLSNMLAHQICVGRASSTHQPAVGRPPTPQASYSAAGPSFPHSNLSPLSHPENLSSNVHQPSSSYQQRDIPTTIASYTHPQQPTMVPPPHPQQPTMVPQPHPQQPTMVPPPRPQQPTMVPPPHPQQPTMVPLPQQPTMVPPLRPQQLTIPSPHPQTVPYSQNSSYHPQRSPSSSSPKVYMSQQQPVHSASGSGAGRYQSSHHHSTTSSQDYHASEQQRSTSGHHHSSSEQQSCSSSSDHGGSRSHSKGSSSYSRKLDPRRSRHSDSNGFYQHRRHSSSHYETNDSQ